MPEITYKELLRSLPQVLQEDRSLSALAEAVAAVLAEEAGKADRARIYPALETQPEEVLDILAYDFKVDWWDPDYTAEEKLQTLRDSFDVHRRLGTKRAVETAISGIYEETKVTEWFEYGGEPYHFKIMIDGHCTPQVIEDLSNLGADGFILGSSALFRKGKTYKEIIRELRGE